MEAAGIGGAIMWQLIITVVIFFGGLFFVWKIKQGTMEAILYKNSSISPQKKAVLEIILYPIMVLIAILLIVLYLIITGDLQVFDSSSYYYDNDRVKLIFYLILSVFFSTFLLFINAVIALLKNRKILSLGFLLLFISVSALLCYASFHLFYKYSLLHPGYNILNLLY